jgi:hypothetical protein
MTSWQVLGAGAVDVNSRGYGYGRPHSDDVLAAADVDQWNNSRVVTSLSK